MNGFVLLWQEFHVIRAEYTLTASKKKKKKKKPVPKTHKIDRKIFNDKTLHFARVSPERTHSTRVYFRYHYSTLHDKIV